MTPSQRSFIHSLARDGELTPDEVLAAAAPEDSPIHDQFEWDDGKAGHTHRLTQARALIRRVRVSVIVDEPVTRQIRVNEYIRDPDKAANEQGYTRSSLIRSREDSARAAYEAELDRLVAHIERFRRLASMLGLSNDCEMALVRLLSGERAAAG